MNETIESVLDRFLHEMRLSQNISQFNFIINIGAYYKYSLQLSKNEYITWLATMDKNNFHPKITQLGFKNIKQKI